MKPHLEVEVTNCESTWSAVIKLDGEVKKVLRDYDDEELSTAIAQVLGAYVQFEYK